MGSLQPNSRTSEDAESLLANIDKFARSQGVIISEAQRKSMSDTEHRVRLDALRACMTLFMENMKPFKTFLGAVKDEYEWRISRLEAEVENGNKFKAQSRITHRELENKISQEEQGRCCIVTVNVKVVTSPSASRGESKTF